MGLPVHAHQVDADGNDNGKRLPPKARSRERAQKTEHFEEILWTLFFKHASSSILRFQEISVGCMTVIWTRNDSKFFLFFVYFSFCFCYIDFGDFFSLCLCDVLVLFLASDFPFTILGFCLYLAFSLHWHWHGAHIVNGEHVMRFEWKWRKICANTQAAWHEKDQENKLILYLVSCHVIYPWWLRGWIS